MKQVSITRMKHENSKLIEVVKLNDCVNWKE